MPSTNAPSAGIASPTIDHNGCGPDEPLGILLQSLGAAEAGQAGTEEVVPSEGARRDTQEPGQARIDNVAPGVAAEADWGQSVFPKIFYAASLQGMDDAYRAIRVNPEHVALVGLTKTHLANECRRQVTAAFQSGDEEALLRLINELDDKVASQLDLAHKWHVVEGLSHLSHRDHDRLAQCFATGNVVDDEWANQNGEWKKMNRKPRVEDLARSIAFPVINDRIPSWLMWLFPVEEVQIGPEMGNRMQTEGLIRTLTTSLMLGASIVIGTPIVVLATEAFPKPANISVLAGSALVFFLFLVWWLPGQDSDHLLLYVLAYLAVLVNVNVGGN
ncbi:unnamed protein product [Clonostachys rhizophaga]|uniref:Uncharacterized protein n=1 Tax=Clonostachys rhizophaga TaxID=160324 RepID=A0A9N9VTA5_9HYPO|nr:unnamed protein product [Clonostachys rhizophaga]